MEDKKVVKEAVKKTVETVEPNMVMELISKVDTKLVGVGATCMVVGGVIVYFAPKAYKKVKNYNENRKAKKEEAKDLQVETVETDK